MKHKNILIYVLAAILLAATIFFNVKSVKVDKNGEADSLYKLCKVWGYAKYNHPAFYDGSKNWDKEFIPLSIKVREAGSDSEVNDILNEWILSLGEAGTLKEEAKENIIKISDTSWINDRESLGSELSDNLKNLSAFSETDMRFAPVLDGIVPSFLHEVPYEWGIMRFGDNNWRLLGLFRLWNAVEYFCPEPDILGVNWDDALREAIPGMLLSVDGADKYAARDKASESYFACLAKMMSKLNDPELLYQSLAYYYLPKFGDMTVPAKIIKAGDSFIVTKVLEPDRPLKAGDIISEVNGKTIPQIIDLRKDYLGCTNESRDIERFLPLVLLTDEINYKLEVIREGEKLSLDVKAKKFGYLDFEREAQAPFKFLDESTGYIDASNLKSGELAKAMESLKASKKLIIDLRWGSEKSMEDILSYITDREYSYIKLFYDSPGKFKKVDAVLKPYDENSNYYKSNHMFPYEGKVIALIGGNTSGEGELTAYIMSQIPEITLVGDKTAGRLGEYAELAVPGGNKYLFKAMGYAGLDGSTLENRGVEPDIYAVPDSKGIKNGIDEVLLKALEL